MNAHPKVIDCFSELRGEFRAAREAKGWTQQNLGDRLGVHWITISKIERGVIGLSRNWIARLSEALGLHVNIDVQSITLGDEIRVARKAKRFRQANVADQLGVTVQAVSQWERDETIPSGINLLKLCGLLGIDLPHGAALNIPDQNVSRLPDLQEQIEEISAFLHALDKIGDGIGGSDGYAVSAVALNAKSMAENVLDALLAMGAK